MSMFGNLKHKIQGWSVISSFLVLLGSCTNQESSTLKVETVRGETQGTTYSVTLVDSDLSVSRSQLDSIFKQFDYSLSTYIPGSLISKMNEVSDSIFVVDTFGYVGACYQVSQSVFQHTDGAFDPSVYPLIKGYGFMDDLQTPISDSLRLELLNMVSFEKNKHHSVVFSGNQINYIKHTDQFKLDFNAVAQGLSVDVIADYLNRIGVSNYYVEVGGEIKVKGHNKDGVPWRIGIDVPKENMEETREIENILSVTEVAVATSGNYRKFYERDGRKYSHTINPRNGLPVDHGLLSATVIAKDCATADAYATAFMVMGTESTLSFIKDHPELQLECYLLEADSTGNFIRKMSEGFSKYLAD